MPGIKSVDLFNVRSGYMKGDKNHDLHADNDDDSRQYCQSCLQYGIRSKLKRRMYKVEKGEGKPKLVPATVPDSDNFRQCHHCGDIVPLYNVKYESKIEDFITPSDNPFDSNPGNMEGFTPGIGKSRLNKFKSIYKRKKEYIESIKDEDIRQEIKEGDEVTVDQFNY